MAIDETQNQEISEKEARELYEEFCGEMREKITNVLKIGLGDLLTETWKEVLYNDIFFHIINEEISFPLTFAVHGESEKTFSQENIKKILRESSTSKLDLHISNDFAVMIVDKPYGLDLWFWKLKH